MTFEHLPTNRSTRLAAVAIAAVMTGGLVSSCGGDGPSRIVYSGADVSVAVAPATNAGSAVGTDAGSTTGALPGTGQMDGVPVPPDAVAYGPPTVDGSTTTQSFRLTGTTPSQAIADYADLATSQGWDVASEPTASGTTDWSLELVRGSETLRVTTSPSTGAQSGSAEALSDLDLQVTTS